MHSGDVDECILHTGETLVCPHDIAHVVLHLNDTVACSEQLITSTNLALSMDQMIGMLWHTRDSVILMISAMSLNRSPSK